MEISAVTIAKYVGEHCYNVYNNNNNNSLHLYVTGVFLCGCNHTEIRWMVTHRCTLLGLGQTDWDKHQQRQVNNASRCSRHQQHEI